MYGFILSIFPILTLARRYKWFSSNSSSLSSVKKTHLQTTLKKIIMSTVQRLQLPCHQRSQMLKRVQGDLSLMTIMMIVKVHLDYNTHPLTRNKNERMIRCMNQSLMQEVVQESWFSASLIHQGNSLMVTKMHLKQGTHRYPVKCALECLAQSLMNFSIKTL